MKKMLQCPTCRRPLVWDKTNTYRPFCSERCKLIDLGEWASDGHAIPGEEVHIDHLDETENKH